MKRKFFQKVGQTNIVPITFKILIIFISLLLLSNFSTNFINSYLSRKQIINLNNTIMISQLKDIHSAAGNQFQISAFTGNKEQAINAIAKTARHGFELKNSMSTAFNPDGKILYFTSNNSKVLPPKNGIFKDKEALAILNENLAAGITDSSIIFTLNQHQYFGVYKYQEDWDCFIIRAEQRADTMKANNAVFAIISGAIFLIVLGFLFAGLYMFKKILQNVNTITADLYKMQQEQKLALIDLENAPNDDVTYLAASFNSLSSTINNLLGIFQKFVSKDVVAKAYNEHQIKLEGSQQNLVMLFSDIKSFTYRTETLGNDIIDLLNVHYNKVIHQVHESSGVIGSIIGDAILAIYGTRQTENKSLDAVDSAWQITKVTATLRENMVERRKVIEKKRTLTEAEERIYQAVLIDVGVGIDGGNVFYGNIGSEEHMTNTVIGDNVNSASRLEGLTRIYKIPIIVSEYIKNEIESAGITKYIFYEIDTVQVKGKTQGKKIYFPMEQDCTDKEKFDVYSQALQAYYAGEWTKAKRLLKKSELETALVFLERMGTKAAPKDWSGIWTMQTK